MDRLRQLASNKRLRSVVSVVVVLLTLSIFTYYLVSRPNALNSLLGLTPLTLLLLTTAYALTVIINAFVLWASLKLIQKPVQYAENIALTGYSSIINFFGPLQSGPGFRAAYLKTKHNVSLKGFFYVTLVFYAFFAGINGLVIAVAAINMLQPSFALPAIIGLSVAALIAYLIVSKQSKFIDSLRQIKLTNKYFWAIGLGAVCLSLATAGAYYIELIHVDSSISISQALVYAAAANLALFVSLTPGAIGFRESFLLLSQQLHGISTDTIIAASIIDRAFYVVFLLVMFVLLVLIGARSRLQQTKTD